MIQLSNNVLASDEPDKIPAGWHEVPVQKLIETHFCGPSPDCEERQIQTEQEWGVLKTTAIVWDGWNESAHKTLPRKFWGLDHLQVQQGDVLITKAGPRDRVAVVVHVTSKPKRIIVSGKMIALRPRQNAVVPQILSGVLGLRRTQDFIHGRTTGMAESQVNFANTVVLEAKVRVPKEITEQSRIAEILDTLDAVIRETEAVVAKLRQVKAGLLHDLLTRGLDAHGHLRDPARHPEQFQDSQLGLVPVGWEIRTLEQITDPRAPICYGIVQVFDHIPNGVLVLAIRDLLGDYATGLHRTLPSIDASYTRSRVRPDDVLISIKGTIGRIGIVPSHYVGNISRDLARIRPVQWVKPRFLLHLLRSPGGQKTLELAQVGTTRAELSIAPLKCLRFAFPTTDEQQQIAGTLDEHDQLIAANEVKLEKLQSLKRGLAHDLLTGRVRVKPTTN